ncbi:hypothetical protein QQF64_019818 [Cirrhinus molitorella]|uniref:Uncharacterized protein n=1 Tax=Cirrhinus molitorella TaxID=172907 RepID=A0ABR3LGJ1_9TELE
MSGTFICGQRSLCFLGGSFRDTSEYLAAQVEANNPSTPFLLSMWGHLTFDPRCQSTIPPLCSRVSEITHDCGRAPGTLFAFPPCSFYNGRKKWPVVILELGWREVTDRRHKPKPGHLFSVFNTSPVLSIQQAEGREPHLLSPVVNPGTLTSLAHIRVCLSAFSPEAPVASAKRPARRPFVSSLWGRGSPARSEVICDMMPAGHLPILLSLSALLLSPLLTGSLALYGFRDALGKQNKESSEVKRGECERGMKAEVKPPPAAFKPKIGVIQALPER